MKWVCDYFEPLNLWNYPDWRYYYMSDGMTDMMETLRREQQERAPHADHYRKVKPEPIEAIEGWGLGFNLGNCIKYIARADHKGSRQADLVKARWYLDREIAKYGTDR
jgi:hypothetical protein